jgi:hypothetical protein
VGGGQWSHLDAPWPPANAFLSTPENRVWFHSGFGARKLTRTRFVGKAVLTQTVFAKSRQKRAEPRFWRD